MSQNQPSARWAGDSSPSLPEPLKRARFISFGGFCWTDGGMAHEIDEHRIETMRTPPFAPPSMIEGGGR